MEESCGNYGVHCHHQCQIGHKKDKFGSSIEHIKEFTREVDRSLDERKYPRKEIIIFESPVRKRQRELHNKTVEDIRISRLDFSRQGS